MPTATGHGPKQRQGKMTITNQYPAVANAIRCIIQDQGSIATRDQINAVQLPATFENETTPGTIDWQAVNDFLATYTQDQLETVCCGCYRKRAKLLNKCGRKIGHVVDAALETLFVTLGG